VVNGKTGTVSGSIQLTVNGIAVNPSTGPETNVVSALTSTCP